MKIFRLSKKNNTIKKALALFFLSYLCVIQIQAQQYQEKHEVSAYIGGGFSSLKYKLSTGGEQTTRYGGNTGLSYMFFLNDIFGIGAGVEIGCYNAKAAVSGFSDRYQAHDGTESFEYRYDVKNYSEKQHALYLNFPINFQIQLPVFSDEHLTYLAIGGKFGIPIDRYYKSQSDQYKISAYYPQYDVLLESPASQGLGTFVNKGVKNNIVLNRSYSITAELGMKWMVSDNYSLYTGIYADYGLSDISTNQNNGYFLEYNSGKPTVIDNKSIFDSRYLDSANGTSHKFVGKNSLIALGIKLKFTFRIPDSNCCF